MKKYYSLWLCLLDCFESPTGTKENRLLSNEVIDVFEMTCLGSDDIQRKFVNDCYDTGVGALEYIYDGYSAVREDYRYIKEKFRDYIVSDNISDRNKFVFEIDGEKYIISVEQTAIA